MFQRVVHFFSHLDECRLQTLLLALLCLFILFGLRITKRIYPKFQLVKYLVGPLIVVVIGLIMSYSLDLEGKGVIVLGDVASGLPAPSLPKVQDFGVADLPDVLIISIIGFVEAILSAKLWAKKHNYQVSPNRELVALGMGNFVGSFFHSYPTFASLSRSAMVDFLGNKTQLFSLVASTMVLLTILFMGPVFYYLPRVVMNSILFVAASSLFEWDDLVFFYRVREFVGLD